jgi:hypothetical protein
MVIEIIAESQTVPSSLWHVACRGTRASSGDGSTKALCCCRKSMPIEAASEIVDMSCSDGDGKDCPVESLAFILTVADNRLGSMARKTVDLSE